MSYASSSSAQVKLSQPRADQRRTAAFPASAMKRAYDIVLSACGLAVVSPLLLVIAALIKLADGGAVFRVSLPWPKHRAPGSK